MRDATGQTGLKLFKGLLRGVASPRPSGALPGAAHRRRAARAHRDRIARRPSVDLVPAVAAPVPHGVARHQPAAVDRRARRHGALERPAPDHALGAPAPWSPASRSCRTTSAGTSRTTSTRASRWPTCPNFHRELRARATFPTESRVPQLSGALAQAVERCQPAPVNTPETTFDDVAGLMRAQTAGRRLLRTVLVDDATVLELLELAGHATADHRRRCAFVVVRDPRCATNSLAPTGRAGRSTNASCAPNQRRRGSRPASGSRTTSKTSRPRRGVRRGRRPGSRPSAPPLYAAAFRGPEPAARGGCPGRVRPRRRCPSGRRGRRAGRSVSRTGSRRSPSSRSDGPRASRPGPRAARRQPRPPRPLRSPAISRSAQPRAAGHGIMGPRLRGR